MSGKPWRRAIPETAKCPLLTHYIMGGEPFCSITHLEYPMLSNDCDSYTGCKHFKEAQKANFRKVVKE